MSHTPGKLAYTELKYEPNRFTVGVIGAQWLLAIQHNGEQMPGTQRENVRRLVACWNACENVATSALEFEPKLMMMDLVNATVQRDELLTAAKAWLNHEAGDGKFEDTLRQIIARSPE